MEHQNKHNRSSSSSNNLRRSSSRSSSADRTTANHQHLGDEKKDLLVDNEGGQNQTRITTLDQYDLELRLAKEEAKRYQSILPPEDDHNDDEEEEDVANNVNVNKEVKKGDRNATARARVVATVLHANIHNGNDCGRQTTSTSTSLFTTTTGRRQKSTISSTLSIASSTSTRGFLGNSIRDNVRRFMKTIAKRMKEEGYNDDDDDDDDDIYTTGSDNNVVVGENPEMNKDGDRRTLHQDRSGNDVSYQPSSSQNRFKVEEGSSSSNQRRPVIDHEQEQQQCQGKTTTTITMHKNMRGYRHQQQRSSSFSTKSATRSMDDDEELRLAKEQARLFHSIVNVPLADDEDDDYNDDDVDRFDGGIDDDCIGVEKEEDVSTIGDYRYHQYRRNSTISRKSTTSSSDRSMTSGTVAAADDTASVVGIGEYQDGLTDDMRRAKEQARIFQSILPSDDEDDIDFCIDDDDGDEEEEYPKDEKEKAEDRDSYPGKHLMREETTTTMGMSTTASTLTTGDTHQKDDETVAVVSVVPSVLQRHDGTYIDAPSRVETQPTVVMMMTSSSSDCTFMEDAKGRKEVVGKKGETKKVSSNDSSMRLGSIKRYLRHRFARACCLLLFSTIGLISLIAWGASSSLWNSSGSNETDRGISEVNGTSHFDDTSSPIDMNPVPSPTSYGSLDQYGDLIPILYGRSTADVAVVVDSAQHQALQWIVSSSLYPFDYEDNEAVMMIRQYYALAVFYYSVEFKPQLTHWLKKTNVPSSTPLLRGSVDVFRTEYDICIWYGITCHQSNTTTSTDNISPTSSIVVEGIHLCKYNRLTYFVRINMPYMRFFLFPHHSFIEFCICSFQTYRWYTPNRITFINKSYYT